MVYSFKKELKMSDLVVITFDNPEEALKVRESLKKMESGGI
jgi:uncharacterized membrane protein